MYWYCWRYASYRFLACNINCAFSLPQSSSNSVRVFEAINDLHTSQTPADVKSEASSLKRSSYTKEQEQAIIDWFNLKETLKNPPTSECRVFVEDAANKALFPDRTFIDIKDKDRSS